MTTTSSAMAGARLCSKPHRKRPSPLLLAVLASVAAPLQATTFDINDDWSFTTRTTLSLGSSWSTQHPNRHLMTRANALQAQGVTADGSSVSADDNRLNFEKGDPISQTFKGLTDLALDGQGQGAFLRLKYWYDHAYETRDGRFKDFDDSGWDDLAKFQGFEALDAYLWKDVEVGGHPLNVKVGKQVLSWGEALLIQNGINVINPLDITAFNRPGVEIKEGQLPVEMLSFSLGISDTLNLEGFYQYNWRPSVLDGCGTFFAASDVIQPGCGPLYLSQVLSDRQMQASGLYATSRGNDSPSDTGQFGFAMRQMLPALNDAEAALYFINYHSRLPYLSLDARNVSLPGTFPGGGQGPSYAAAFPEDIRLYGVSLTGVEPYSGISLATELSYRPNMPLSFNAPDVVTAVVSGAPGSSWLQLPADFNIRAGDRLDAWERKGVWQWTGSATQAIDNVLGATRLSLFGEVGVVHIDDLGDERLGRNAAFGRSAPLNGTACNTPASGVTNRYCTDKGFTTDWSWGYRLRASLEYSDVLPGVNLIPAVNWRHDVEGYSYDPVGPFQEGQQALGLSLTANYLNDYSVELAYNSFFGSNDYSTLDDRDFASVSFKVDF
ncbi:DUF1302 domain-containing protein [Pseudomonas sp. JQ170]|uniref:DUF1302 domain-containing protein n=1 Tax=unclassified Pseudomonas TaxID=196821 RepID=UPI00264B18DA|nr:MULTISPECIES: DUF1302 domain-containing protein [unclassified Pseudomonas]MDN7141302.1 DUF1302 domain-containing protein [Pseudomonas sp. JQ170]WRO78121.1 DUF1302 domain-containing protein [Pseudomonas sp. 170C]